MRVMGDTYGRTGTKGNFSDLQGGGGNPRL